MMNEQDMAQVAHDVEQSFLGSLLIERDAMPIVAGTITAEAFANPMHRTLFEAMGRLWDRRVPADPTTVIGEVRAMGHDDDKFPVSYLSTLLVAVPTAAHVEYYAGQVMQFARRRALADVAQHIVRAAYGPEEATDTGELVAELRRRVEPFEAASRQATVSMETFADDVALEAVAAWEGRRIDPVVPTGLQALDKTLTGGMRPGQLIVIGARPGMGKTALMLHFAMRTRAHLVSLEMGKGEIGKRLIALAANVPYSVADDELGSETLRNAWLNGVPLARMPVTVNDVPRQSTFEIEAEVQRLIAEQGTNLLVIDHLDWLGDRVRTDSQEARTAELVHRCKAIARVCQIPVVLLAQLNRNVEKRPGFLPYLSDFRNSGAIEQDADVALLLYRRRYYSERGMLDDDIHADWLPYPNGSLHKVEVIVAKNRNGPIGTVHVGWKPDVMAFRDVVGMPA